MPLRNTETRWGAVAQTFHWLIAALVIAQGAIGLTMVELSLSPAKIKVYALHKSIGLTVLALALLRLAWRAGNRAPRDPAATPHWQRIAARVSHAALYVLILALPLSGWLFNSASNFPLAWFGLVHLPSQTGHVDAALKAFALTAHVTLFWILVVVLVVHVGAALWHHYELHDDVLRRMLPWTKRRAPMPTGESL